MKQTPLPPFTAELLDSVKAALTEKATKRWRLFDCLTGDALDTATGPELLRRLKGGRVMALVGLPTGSVTLPFTESHTTQTAEYAIKILLAMRRERTSDTWPLRIELGGWLAAAMKDWAATLMRSPHTDRAICPNGAPLFRLAAAQVTEISYRPELGDGDIVAGLLCVAVTVAVETEFDKQED